MKNTTRHENSVNGDSMPKAMIHKKILEAAKNRPDASIETLAEQIDGSTVHLVERVLDQYGDPASKEDNESAETAGDTGSEPGDTENFSESQPSDKTMNQDQTNSTGPDVNQEQTNGTEPSKALTPDSVETAPEADKESLPADAAVAESPSEERPTETATDRTEEQRTVSTDASGEPTETDRAGLTSGERKDSSSASDTRRVPDPDSLTEKRVEVLRAIQQRPHATQAQLADELSVSRATISQRVNAIDGFEWSDRQEYVEALFDGHGAAPDANSPSIEQLTTQIESLTHRIDHLEQIITERPDTQFTAFDDTELAATVVRACLDSDTVTEQEEQRIIAEVIDAGRYPNR